MKIRLDGFNSIAGIQMAEELKEWMKFKFKDG